MPRTEQKLMDGWEFAAGEPLEENYRSVILPHDWAVEAPFDRRMPQGGSQGFRDRFETLWYRRHLNLREKKAGCRYFLDFGGVFENSTVWLNGQEAGGNKYGYSPFRIDVTDLVKQGDNLITVKADNTRRPADRWLSAAGIYRTVKWMEMEERHLDEREVTVHTRLLDGKAELTVDCGIQACVKGVLSCDDQRIETVSDDGKLLFEVPSPRLWSAEQPLLYSLSLSLMDGQREADTISMKLGIREVVFDPNQGMLVNGRRTILKGVCVHQDLGCLGNAARKELWRERLLDLKETGCNAIRAAHHLFPEEFLDLCDELGFYVYEECFDKWQSGLYGRYFDTQCQYDVACMVKRDRNRPSIVIWGVGNEVENQGQLSMLKNLKMLCEYLRSLDNTRPVSVAMNPHFKRESGVDARKVADIQQFVDEVSDTEIYDMEERLERIGRIAELVDILCCNYQEQWYPQIHQRFPDKLILGTEVYQYFMGHPEQMKNFTAHLPSLVPFELDYVIGSMIWTGFDYLGESMGYPSKGWSGALIRTTGDRRPSYYMMQSLWSEKPMVHFSVLDHSLEDEGVKEMWDIPPYADHWDFPQIRKAVIPYMIASNCEEVRLFLNGERIYLPRPDTCLNRLITGYLPYLPGKVEAVGFRDGTEVCRHTLVTPGPAVRLAFETPERTVPAESGYTLLLRVCVLDAQDNRVFRESARVRFRVEGEAEVLAVDSGDLMSSEPYQDDSVHLYRGCAAVVLHFTGKPGRVRVFADAGGMRTGEAEVLVRAQETR